MTLTRAILLFFAVTIRCAYAEAPKPMVDYVLALTEAAAILNVCFESPAYEQLDDTAALRFFDLTMRLTSLVKRISDRYDDEALYIDFEVGRVMMSSGPALQRYVQVKYQFCSDSLFDEMGAYVSETESQLNQFLDR